MTMSYYLKLYLLTVPVFFLIDLTWLGFLAKDFYRENIGHILSPNVNWPAAITFYLVYIVGILIFAVLPALERGSLKYAVIWGALFGFFTYGTYELTNLATARDWPLKMVLVDTSWGVFLCTSVAAGSYAIGNWLR